MRRSKTIAALAMTTMAITAAVAVNNANAAPSNGSLTGDGVLLLCVSEGRGYVVADGPDFIQTPTLNNTCAAPQLVEAGTYHVKADKYIDALCWNGSPRVTSGLEARGRCHAKVHHAHTTRYTPPGNNPLQRPPGAPFTTIEVPDYVVVNVVRGDTTEVRMHVVDLDYPECITPPAGRSCDAHPVTGPAAGT